MLSLWVFSIQFIKNQIGKAYFFLLTAVLFWTLMQIGELVAVTLPAKMVFVRLQFIGINSVPLTLLSLASKHSNIRFHRVFWLSTGVIWFVLLLFIIVVPEPNYFWGEPVLYLTEGSIPIVDYNYGPLFNYLFIPFAYILYLTSFYIFVKGLASRRKFYKMQILLIGIGALLPAVSNILYVLNISFVPHVNFTTVWISISALMIGFALYRYRYLDVNPVPREKLLESITDGIVVIDYNYRLLDINYAAKNLLSIKDTVVGETADEVLPEKMMSFLRPLLTREGCTLHLLRYEDKVFDVRISPLTKIGGAQSGYLIMFHDITEREVLHQKIKEKAKLDPLTQILNRRELFNRIEKERSEVKNEKIPLSILMMDIDHFKMINDTYGHEAGDRTIEKIVESVESIIGSHQIFGRYGGDEFVIALKNTPSSIALRIARDIHNKVATNSIVSRNASFNVHLSIGVITVGGDDDIPLPDSSDALVALADAALYRAKEKGRNTVVSLSADDDHSFL